MKSRALLLILLVLIIGVLVFIFYDQFSLSAAKLMAEQALAYINENPFRGVLIFIGIYFVLCALPMPFVSVPTMMAGYLFGHFYGLLIVSFVSALGGTCLFMVTRYLCRDWAQQIFSKRLTRLQTLTNTHQLSVALSVRFIPGMPFFIPAIAFGLSQLSVFKFYLSTQMGLLAILFVYVNAGQSLSEIQSIQDLFTFDLIVSMLLLTILPIAFDMISKKIVFKNHRVIDR